VAFDRQRERLDVRVVPFSEPVQTTTQLCDQLNRILETPPEWDALFESTTDIFERELASEHAPG